MMAVDGVKDDYLGTSVALAGNLALVGARDHDSLSGSNVGAAYLYNLFPERGPDIALSPSYIQGGTLAAGITKSTKTFTQHNTGQEALAWSIGQHEAWFTASPNLGTLAPSQTQSITIEIDATTLTAGLWRDELRIMSNDPDEPLLEAPLLTRVISPTTEIQLTASNRSEHERFGSSVSLSGDFAIVGVYGDDDNGSNAGAVYICRWDGSTWLLESKLLADDGEPGDKFGRAVSISRDLLIVGASNGSGSAYIYRWTGTDWQEEAKLLTNDGTAGLGKAVAISGNKAIVGANQASYVYRWDGNRWLQEAKLIASDGATENSYGASVSISGDIALIGAYSDDEHDSNAGAVYAYHWNGKAWQAEAKLFPKEGNRLSVRSFQRSKTKFIICPPWGKDS